MADQPAPAGGPGGQQHARPAMLPSDVLQRVLQLLPASERINYCRLVSKHWRIAAAGTVRRLSIRLPRDADSQPGLA